MLSASKYSSISQLARCGRASPSGRKSAAGGRSSLAKASSKLGFSNASHNVSRARSPLVNSKRSLTTSTSGHLPSAEDTLSKIQPTMERLIKEQYIKGLAAAIIVDGKVAYKQYGHFHVGVEPVSDEASKDLVFEIGSISKPLTGVALASLLEEGKVAQDAQISDVTKHLKKSSAIGSRTVQQLATHTSGLPRLPSDFFENSPDSDPYSKYSNADMMANLNRLDDLKPAGTSWEYSNLGFGLLGAALPEVHSPNATFDSMMRDLIFSPLEMQDTSTTTRLTTTGHNEDLIAVPEWKFHSHQGAGGLRSTPNDMIKFLAALVNPAESKLKKAIERSTQVATGEGIVPHGLGWVLKLGDHEDVVWHNGATAGYHCFMAVHKTSNRGVLVMSNTATDYVTRAGAYTLFNLMGIDKKLPMHDYCPDEIYEELMREYVGLYRYKGNLNFKILLNRGKLFVQIPGTPPLQLHPETPFKWHIRSTGGTIEFDGTEWESGLPPHTLVYKEGNTSCQATRDGQEFRKFLIRSKNMVSKLFGRGAPKMPNAPETSSKE